MWFSGVTVKKLKTQGWWAGNTTMVLSCLIVVSFVLSWWLDQVVFEDVKVPVEYLIGQEGMGF